MNSSSRPKVLLQVAIGVLFTCGPILAQSTFGSIVGQIADESGALIPGVVVTVRNLDENTTRTIDSNSAGLYEALNLKPGRYEILASKSGFASTKVPSVSLEARQTLRADLKLGLAALNQSVTVQSEAATLNTENGTIADAKTNREITQLPVNYRGRETSPLAAIATVPGVQQDASGNISVGGGLPAMVDYTVDGISTTSVRSNGPLREMYPSSEMLSEFRVTSVNNNAEFAQMGDVTVTTKSGANQVHGSGFWYHQNAALDATPYGSNGKPAKVFNTFGGSFSGPVVIPKLYNGRDKTFFFVDYEGNREPGSTSEQFSVPTVAMRSGNLNGVPGAPAVDPTTGLPFPNNTIPGTRLNSVADTLLNSYYPLPNYGGPTATYANYRILNPTPLSTDGYDLRFDHYLRQNQQLFGRFSWKRIPSENANGLLPNSTVNLNSKNLIISYNYSFRPNLINEFRYGLSYWESVERFPINGAQAIAKLGITGLDISNHLNQGAFPTFDFSDGTGFSAIGRSKDGPTRSRTNQFSDNLSWVKGRHTMKFGGDIRHLEYQDLLLFGGSDDFGSFDFNQGAFSGNAFADLLLGLPHDSYYSVTSSDLDQLGTNYNFFAQDEWRVNARLTVSAGLRWELHPGFTEAHGNITNFNHLTGNVVIPDKTLPPSPGFLVGINACGTVNATSPCTQVLTASQAGLPDSLRKTYFGNWDPRISFAYRPFGNRTVFRSGFGVFTQTVLGPMAYGMTGIHTSDTRQFTNFLGSGIPPVFVLPTANGGSYALSPAGTEDFIDGTSFTYKDPRTYQWNFTIEHEVTSQTLVRASYIGSNSVGLNQNVDYNQVHASTTPFSSAERPFQNWNRLVSRENLGFAAYEGLQAEVRHRTSGGLTLQGSYSLAKDLGNAGVGTSNLTTETGHGVSDRFNTRLDRGNIGGIRRNRFLFTSIYQLPFGRGRHWLSHSDRVVDAVLGGWELSTVTLVQSGPFLTPYISKNQDQSNTDVANRFDVTARPDRLGNPNLSSPSINGWWNMDAFVPTPVGAGRFGNAGVGIMTGPGTVAIAGGLAKTFPVTERLRLRLEATFTNLPNHPNYAAPNTNISNPSFGQVTAAQTSENSGSRSGQLSARFDF